MTITKEELKSTLCYFTASERKNIDGKTYIPLNGIKIDDFISYIHSMIWQLQNAKDMRHVKSFACDTSKNKIQVDI